MFLLPDKDINKYIDTTKSIKEYLTTIKVLENKGNNADEIYKDLFNLSKTKYASKSELNCFINACDSATSTIKDINIFKEIIQLYFKHREFNTESTPAEWIQAIIDKGSSRGSGSLGEDKLVDLAIQQDFIFTDNWDDFLNIDKAIAKFSKNNFDLNNVKTKLGIDLNFNSQGKMLDIIFKNRDNFMFIEAKHLKEGGGSQDKQIKELIDIIAKTPNKNNVYYGAFLDGVYSNILLDITEENISNPNTMNKLGNNKVTSQKIDIIKTLSQNSTSFWFNTAGITEFLKDF
jgi:hypothetical protein